MLLPINCGGECFVVILIKSGTNNLKSIFNVVVVFIACRFLNIHLFRLSQSLQIFPTQNDAVFQFCPIRLESRYFFYFSLKYIIQVPSWIQFRWHARLINDFYLLPFLSFFLDECFGLLPCLKIVILREVLSVDIIFSFNIFT